MPDLKTSALPALSNIVGTEMVAVAYSGANYRMTPAQLKAYVLNGLAAGSVSGLAAVATSGSASDLGSGTLPAARLPLFTSALNGAVPASGGGTANFLRADGSWAAPAGGGSSGTTTSAVTFNSTGSGASPGTAFNGSAPQTVSYNTLGAVPAGAITASGLTMATARFLGRTTASTGAVEELNATQMKSALAITAADTSGFAAVATSGSASDLSAGTLAAARLPARTGDVTSAAGSAAYTLATVNSNTGSFGSTSAVPVITVNAKGLITAASTVALGTAATKNLAVGTSAPSSPAVNDLWVDTN